MNIFWICAFLFVSAAYGDHALANDYDDYYTSLEDLDKLIKDYEQINEKTDIENDLKVEEEIQEFRKGDEVKDAIDSIEDYQFEDNRDKDIDDDNENLEAIDESEKDNEENLDNDEKVQENRPEEHNQNADYALLWGDDNIAPLPVPDENVLDDTVNEAILEETQKILEEPGADDFDENDQVQTDDSGFGDEIQNNENLEIKEETEQILQEEGADKFDENDEEKKSDDSGIGDEIKDNKNLDIKEETEQILQEEGADNLDENDDVEKSVKTDQEDVKAPEETEEDTVDKAYEDLNADLDKLFDTLNKLRQADDNLDDNLEDKNVETNDAKLDELVDENDKEAIEELNKITEETNASDAEKDVETKQDDVKEIIEEDTIGKAYDDLNADLDKLFDTLDKLEDGSNDNDENLEKMEKDIDDLLEWDDFENGSDEVAVDFDKLLENIRGEDDMKEGVENTDMKNDEMNEQNPDDAQETDVENIGLNKIIFGDDALIDEQNDENKTPKDFKTASVDDLNSAQLDDLVSQFSILHSEDLDVRSENFVEKSSAPIHITLKVDEPTIITSPDYPSPYPTNNIVDWIISGDGVGIEFNITEFAVNGAMGDYLLVKPGGVDESGHEGILFTYRLNEGRRYRFTDVDRVFMRFEAKPGMMFFRGFSISAQMIAPLTDMAEDIPEPEPVVTPPHSTYTVHLATSVLQFQQVKEEFRALVASMAVHYTREFDVDPGYTPTSNVTQITSVHLCPVSWPNFEECVAVTFGVPLEYDEEETDRRLNEDDLRTMWRHYSNEEQFVTELEKMGLSEFSQPDGAALTAWLLLAAGVLLAMVVLAAALWRYSCCDDYTRMKTYSETDSVHNDKRVLDLYPTPHQHLPPLYAESEYKWAEDDATRVDMGGFANRSYATDNMYDFDSDEDVIVTRDRNDTATPKDISKV